MRFLKSKSGFSLVELMIVVAIIGILAAVAIPNFVRFQVKARQAEAKSDLGAIYAAEKAFNAEWQQFYTDFIEIGYRPEGAFRYEHGFGAAGVNSPATYTGMIGPNAAATAFSTNAGGTQCGQAPVFVNMCSVDRAPQAGAVPALAAGATTLTVSTFWAIAQGNIDDDVAIDYWTVDQNKMINGPGSASAFPVVANGGDLDN